MNLSVKNYVPRITGTINCTDGKTVSILVTNKTSNSVISEEIIRSEDGQYEISYTLPSLINSVEYSVEVAVNNGSSQQVVLSVDVDSAVFLVEFSGNIDVADDTRLEVSIQSEGIDLINKDVTVTSPRTLGIRIPNIIANANVNLIAEGYETYAVYPQPPSQPDIPEDIVDKVVQNTHEDSYGDNIEEATEIPDIFIPVLGTVDEESSDYIMFVAPESANYAFDNISLENSITTLYSSNKEKLKSGTSFEYGLYGGETYYLEFSSNEISQYISTVMLSTDSIDEFDIHKYDEANAVYKSAIEELCEDIYSDDADKSKTMYAEYNRITDIDADLHKLPGFLGNYPKEALNYDRLINRYYKIYHTDFDLVSQLYYEMISGYDEEYGYSEPGDVSGPKSNFVPKVPIDINSEEYLAGANNTMRATTRRREASLEIDNLTPTSIEFTMKFPSDKSYGNVLFLVDFNCGDGITRTSNVYRKRDDSGFYMYGKTDTIEDLQPGGEYILYITWPSEDGTYFGGDCSICRRIKLPYNYEEEKELYEGEHVSVLFETADVERASQEDFELWMERMDLVYEGLEDLTGYTPYGGRNIVLESTREYLSDKYDAIDGEDWWEIVSGYSGNPIVCGQAFVQSLMIRLQENDWGDLPIHELSHDFDNKIWRFDSHALCYLKMHYVLDVISAKVYREDVGTGDEFDNSLTAENDSGEWYSQSYVDFLYEEGYYNYCKYFGEGMYHSTGMAYVLITIQDEIGWEPFRRTFRYFSSLDKSQIPSTKGGKLNLFLTKLKDYSGYNVFNEISDDEREVIEDYFGSTLQYVDAPYPLVVSDSGKSYEVKDSFSTFQFTAAESANYNIFTSPYYNSGLSNDTVLEVYSDYKMTDLIVSNDDYEGTRFSKVILSATEGRTYYIRVKHYSDGYVLSMLNVVCEDPVGVLSLDEPLDIISRSGEYEMLSFTPEEDGVYVFSTSNYNGGNTSYDTYIKIYGDSNKSQLLGKHNNKVILRLQADKTYYLQFSGLYMRYARARISVKNGHILEFSTSPDSNFIYINSPEFITNVDIIDDKKSNHLKLFEERDISGKNTYYQTHSSWFGNQEVIENHYPQCDFYVDVDFYNPGSNPVTVTISNLTYGDNHLEMTKYFNLGDSEAHAFVIAPGEHQLLFEGLGVPYLIVNPNGTTWARIIMLLFDFEVTGGSVAVSSFAAYNTENMHLMSNTYGTMQNGTVLDTGEIQYVLDGSGNAIWGKDEDPRLVEPDYYAKIKGIARNQSAVIESQLDILIDEETSLGCGVPITFSDSYYQNAIKNPKNQWITHLSPFNDKGWGLIYALPDYMHKFTYHRDNGGIYNFTPYYRTLKGSINDGATGNQSVNEAIPEYILANARLDVEYGWKAHFPGKAVDALSLSLGEYGATYHYTVTVSNTTNTSRKFTYRANSVQNMCAGIRFPGETEYITKLITEIPYCSDECEKHDGDRSDCTDWEPIWHVDIPPKATITFEIVTMLTSGDGGGFYSIVID